MANGKDDPHKFVFELDRALLEQVLERLDASPMLQLRKGVGPALSGIYVLYHKGKLIYVGKASKETTKSKRTLRSRLNEHVSKLVERSAPLKDFTCRYLTFESEWYVF